MSCMNYKYKNEDIQYINMNIAVLYDITTQWRHLEGGN
jgi:hypothetical protein